MIQSKIRDFWTSSDCFQQCLGIVCTKNFSYLIRTIGFYSLEQKSLCGDEGKYFDGMIRQRFQEGIFRKDCNLKLNIVSRKDLRYI